MIIFIYNISEQIANACIDFYAVWMKQLQVQHSYSNFSFQLDLKISMNVL